jgi:hypothetical protein
MRKYEIAKQIDFFRTLLASGRPTKTCPKCGVEKPVNDFPMRSSFEPRPNAYCYPCQREYNRQHYRVNASKHNSRRYANQLRYKRRNRDLMRKLLETKRCVDCGESDPVVLEFDHVRGKKLHEISNILHRLSWKRICEEMAKCEIRCANCHRKRTAIQLWWRK